MRVFGPMLVLCVLGFSGLAFAQTLPATTQATFTLSQADAFWQQHDYAQAVEAYRSVLHTQTPTAPLYDKLASALHEQNLGEPSKWQDEQTEWQHALVADAKNIAALRGMFDLQRLRLEFFPSAKSITDLRSAAAELLAADSADQSARQWTDASYLIEWLLDADAPDHDMNVHRQALQDQLAKDAKEPIFAHYVARTFIRQAVSLQTKHVPDEVKSHLASAIETMQKSVDADPKDATGWLLFYRVLLEADEAARNDDKHDTHFADRIPEVLHQAREAAQPDDIAASEITIASAAYLADHKQVDAARKMLRDRLAAVPGDQSTRLFLAKLSDQDPLHRSEIIDLLRQPVTDHGGPLVLNWRVHSSLESETQVELIGLLISQWSITPPSPQRQQLADEMDHCMADLQRIAPQSILTLQTHARLLLVRGGSEGLAEAVPELEKAQRLYQLRSGDPHGRDWDVEYLLATAYSMMHQTGLAKTLLWQIVDARPDVAQPHKSLLRLLVLDREPDLAQEQLEHVIRMTPLDPDIPQYKALIAVLKPGGGQRPDVQAVLKALPESTPQQIEAKINDERAAGQNDEVIRLYELLRKQNPADISVVDALLTLYVAGSQNDQAQRVIQEALAADPKNLALQLADAQFHQDAARIDQVERQQIDALSDPFDQDMAWFNYLRRRDPQAALQRLDDAEKLRPQDPKLLNERLNIALRLKHWDKAEDYLQRLGKLNADDTGGLYDRCRIDIAKGDNDAALKDAQDLVKRYPQFIGCWTMLGSVYQTRGEYEKAVDPFKQALQRQNESTEALRGLLECSVALHQPQEARHYIDLALRIDPTNAYFRAQSAAWEKANCTAEEIVARRKAASDSDPQSLDARRELFLAYYHVASDTHAQADIDRSAAVAEQIKKQWPDDRFGYIAIADAAKLRKDLVAGERALCELADRPVFAKSAWPYVALALYYEAFQRNDLEEYAFRQALDRDHDSVQAQLGAATFLMNQKRYEEALGWLNANSPDMRIRGKVISCLMSLNRSDDAVKACDAWLAIHPGDANVWYDKGLTLGKAHHFPEAIEAASHCLQINPGLLDAWYLRGWSYLRMGPPYADKAVADLHRACHPVQPPDHIDPARTEFLVQAYLAAGKPKDAIEEMQALIRAHAGKTINRRTLIDMYLHQDALNADAIEQLIPSLKQFDATQKTFADWVSYCAEIYMWEGHNDTAINCVRTGLDASQGQPSHDPLMPWLLMTLLRDHQDQHVLDESDAWHGKQFDPDVTNLIQAARAVAEQRLNRPDDAAHDLKQVCANISAAPAPLTKGNTVSLLLYRELPYEQAVDLLSQAGSGDPVWMCFVMLMCRQHQDYTRAAIMADKIAAATLASDKPEYVNLRYNRALVYALAGQSDKAKALLDSIYWDNRDFPMSMFLEGVLTYCDLLNPSDTARAQQLFNHVPLLSASYSLAFVWDAQGWLLIRSGHMDDGLKYLNAANAIMPSATIHYHLGQAYESQGKHDQALAEWHRAQKILAANPRSFDALYHVTSGYDDLIALPLQHALQASH